MDHHDRNADLYSVQAAGLKCRGLHEAPRARRKPVRVRTRCNLFGRRGDVDRRSESTEGVGAGSNRTCPELPGTAARPAPLRVLRWVSRVSPPGGCLRRDPA